MRKKENGDCALLAAMAAPILHTASGCGWGTVLGAGIVCAGVCAIVGRICSGTEIPREMEWLKCAWIGVLLWTIMPWSANGWPEAGRGGIPFVLLALAAWTAHQRTGERAVGVLRYGILLLLGVILLAGVRNLRIENVNNAWGGSWEELSVMLLLPAVGMGRNAGNGIKAGALALAASVITAGVLTGSYAVQSGAPFYEMSRSITLSGAVKRMESLTAVLSALGYYAAMCFLLEKAGKHWLIAAGIGAVGCLLGWKIDGIILATGTAVILVLIPLVTALWKNLRNYEKSA